MTIADRLAELGIELPPAAAPGGNYTPANRAGDFIFLSGQLPTRDGELLATGKVGGSVSVEDAQMLARQAALNALAAAAQALDGGLDNIEKVARTVVYVNAEPNFDQQSIVANGASDVLVDILGEAGKHARSAIGVGSLPRNAPVEVEITLKVR